MRSGGSKTHRKKQQKDRKIHIFDQNKRCIASLDVTQGIAEAELIVSSEKGLSVLFYVCDTECIPKDTIAEWEKDEIPSRKRASSPLDVPHLAAGEMLQLAMEHLGYGREHVKKDYIAMKGEKPYFDTIPFEFSISHSHSLVALALVAKETEEGDENRLGIDIETDISGRHINAGRMASRFFTETEERKIRESECPLLDFMKIWVIKEAWMKAEKIPLSEAFSMDVKEKLSKREVFYIEGDDLLGVIVV